jgi:hypothetical protein
MPCGWPDGEVIGVLKSPWSSHTTSKGRPSWVSARAVPREVVWSPPRVMGGASPGRQFFPAFRGGEEQASGTFTGGKGY